jgi:transcription antitermination factor NusG
MNEPAPLPTGFVEQLRACAVKHPEKNGASLLMPGTTVKITAGPFANRDAVVIWADVDRVALLVWLLNRQVQVTVSVGDVAVV